MEEVENIWSHTCVVYNYGWIIIQPTLSGRKNKKGLNQVGDEVRFWKNTWTGWKAQKKTKAKVQAERRNQRSNHPNQGLYGGNETLTVIQNNLVLLRSPSFRMIRKRQSVCVSQGKANKDVM